MTELSSPPRPGLDAFARATRAEPADLVRDLRELLGAQLVAYLGGVKETRAVRQWADGTRDVNPKALGRLRLSYQLAALVTQRDTPEVAQVWFQGLNPALDDRSPARLVREGDLEKVGPQVLAAARAFATTG